MILASPYWSGNVAEMKRDSWPLCILYLFLRRRVQNQAHNRSSESRHLTMAAKNLPVGSGGNEHDVVQIIKPNSRAVLGTCIWRCQATIMNIWSKIFFYWFMSEAPSSRRLLPVTNCHVSHPCQSASMTHAQRSCVLVQIFKCCLKPESYKSGRGLLPLWWIGM